MSTDDREGGSIESRLTVLRGADESPGAGAAVVDAVAEGRVPPPADPVLGTTVGGIRIIDVAGRGGMGEVYVGYDERLGRRVALKAVRNHLTSDPDVRARFLYEARVLSQLEHPHICRVYDLIEQTAAASG